MGVGLRALKPASGEGRGVFLGVLLALVLHPIAFIVVAIAGTAVQRDGGALLVLPFIMLIGVTEWLYLAPIAWLLWRRGSTAVAKGVIIAGGLATLANSLCYGAVGVMSLQNKAEVSRIQQYERDHPRDYISAKGVVTAVDDTHFTFRNDDGAEVTLRTWDGLDYIFLKKDGGFEKRNRDMLKPGVRVSVEYSQDRGKPPDSASIVRVHEEGTAR